MRESEVLEQRGFKVFRSVSKGLGVLKGFQGIFKEVTKCIDFSRGSMIFGIPERVSEGFKWLRGCF